MYEYSSYSVEIVPKFTTFFIYSHVYSNNNNNNNNFINLLKKAFQLTKIPLKMLFYFSFKYI